MTDVLTSSSRRAATAADAEARRPLAVSAVVAGAVAPLSVLLACMAVGLAGWFASDAGRYGDTKDAMRVGADAWLLAHGARLQLDTVEVTAQITAIPLGLTLVSAYVTYRLGRWAGTTSLVDGWLTSLTGAVALSGVYAIVAVTGGILASAPGAEPHLGLAFLGAFVLALLAGGLGILTGSGQTSVWHATVPVHLRTVVTAALAGVLLMVAAGSLLLVVSLALDFGEAATVLSRLHVDVSGGVLYSLVVAAMVPNAVLLTTAYLLGPGFMVGTGTVVSPTAVVLGPVPAFPLLAALPDDTATPWWTVLAVGVPVLVTGVAVALTLRHLPVTRYETGAVLGLAAGALGAVALTLLTVLAGGAVGPGRMADVGVWPLQTAGAAVVAMGTGGLLGGAVTTWRRRRRERGRAAPSGTASS